MDHPYETHGTFKRDCRQIDALKANGEIPHAYQVAKAMWPRIMSTAKDRRDDWQEMAMYLLTTEAGNWILQAVHTPSAMHTDKALKSKERDDKGRYLKKGP